MTTAGAVGFLRALRGGTGVTALGQLERGLQGVESRLQRLRVLARPPARDRALASRPRVGSEPARPARRFATWGLPSSPAAAIIGAVNLVLLVRETRKLERSTLDALHERGGARAGASGFSTLSRRATEWRSTSPPGTMVSDNRDARRAPLDAPDRQVVRVEVFSGLRKEVEALPLGSRRWRRLETTWLPTNPRIGRAGGGPAARPHGCRRDPAQRRVHWKLCAAVPGGSERARRWVVVTEPLDTAASRANPAIALVGGSRTRVACSRRGPKCRRRSGAELESLAVYLPRGPSLHFFGALSARRHALQSTTARR